jgi:hypothetical protein
VRLCDLQSPHRSLLLAVVATLATLPGPLAPRAAEAAGPPPCFQTSVTYLGRIPVANIGGVQFYRWSYRVCGLGCTNRALSHWTLGLCASTLQQTSGVTTQSSDATDVLNGLTASYLYEMGNDPTTGLFGLKWNFAGGNPVDRALECDEFSFVATGGETVLHWATKGARLVATGTTIGPGCAPVPVAPKSWSSIKTHRYR